MDEMCWVCAADKSALAKNFLAAQSAQALLHFQSATAAQAAMSLGLIDGAALTASKNYDAFPADSVGDGKSLAVAAPTVLIVTPDDIANDTSTSTSIQVDGAHIISTINTVGDWDFVKVELEAGHMYDIGQYLVTGGSSGVPLADAYLEVYRPDGTLLTNADGGGPNTPQGLDALITLTVKESGTYYINARAFDQTATNGTGGDTVGDYELFVKDVTGRPDTGYTPYYDVENPLHSLDWGSQVDRTSRNPDGAEGPRVTGNAPMGAANNFGIEGKNVITVYYAKAGDVFVSQNPTNPGLTENIVAKGLQAWEKEAFETALDFYEQVADLVFVEVANREEADFKIITYNGTPGAGASLLGRMNPPNEGNEGQAEFNSGDVRWTPEGLQRGGFYFPTLIHEFGHGLGMAHPHDNGGRSSIMRGAGSSTTVGPITIPEGIGGAMGDYNLSQQVHTIMSYNDGWSTSPYGQPRSGGITGTQVDHFGWVASLSPLDIAVIQDKYGVNEEWAAGDNTYVLKDVNAPGTFYESIWDAGGTDAIVYDGVRDANIDLRDATLQYEEGGGGRVSYAYGVHGGFTIANAVTIENARGGGGNDTLTGNEAANTLDGAGGNDVLAGGDGGDTLIGGAGTDTLSGGGGADTFRFAAGDSAIGSGRDRITDFDGDLIDLSGIGATRFIDGAAFSGLAGQVRAVTFAGSTIVEADTNGDRLTDFQLEIAGSVPLTVDTFVGLADANGATNGADTLSGTAGVDKLNGRGGNDSLSGLGSNDVLNGGAGDDRLTGGSGVDRFLFEDGGTDTITDYRRGETIDLSAFGIDSSAVTLSRGKVFVELGEEDLTILVQGDSVRMSNVAFEPAGLGGSSAMQAQTEYVVAA
jgi:serralysin